MEPWMLKELARCARDPLYFIKHYVYINTKDKGMQLFKLYDFQEELIIKFNKHRFNIIKFPRQCGKCLHRDEIIYIKNKEGIEMEFTMEEFHNMLQE
jgi:hypothetical protein